MNRLTRLTAILIHLQSKRVVTAKEIANRFEVSLRTIYRDIKTLQDAGVPIGSKNGNGYFVVEGYYLPPVMISEEELNALIASEQLVLNQGDLSLKRDFNALMIKIRSILKNYQKDHLSIFENRIGPSYENPRNESNALSEIQKAIVNLHVLDVQYYSNTTKGFTRRKIEPIAISFTEKSWYMLAFCRLRNEIREFRLDRIVKLKTLSEKFESRKNFDLRKYYDQMPDYS